MRRGVSIVLALLLVVLVTASARAATLGYSGTLTLSVSPHPWYWLPATANATVAGSGTALVNGSGGGLHLSSLAIGAGAFGPFSTAVTWIGSASPTVNSVRFTNIANLTGSFGPGLSGGPPGSGTMGLTGLAKVCLAFAPCNIAAIVVPLSPTVGGAGFGVGGTQLTTPIPPGGFQLTLQHAAWTLGQPVMTIHSPNSTITTPVLPGGFAHGPASLTSSTAFASGVVQLVTVTKVFTGLAGLPEFPVAGVLNLHFVPEPGTLLLLGSGVAVLAAAGRRRSPH